MMHSDANILSQHVSRTYLWEVSVLEVVEGTDMKYLEMTCGQAKPFICMIPLYYGLHDSDRCSQYFTILAR